MGIPVTPAEAQFIAQLKEVRHPDRLPAPLKAGAHLAITLGSLRFNVDLMAEQIEDIERRESAIALDIAGIHQVCLVTVVKAQCLRKIGILSQLE